MILLLPHWVRPSTWIKSESRTYPPIPHKSLFIKIWTIYIYIYIYMVVVMFMLLIQTMFYCKLLTTNTNEINYPTWKKSWGQWGRIRAVFMRIWTWAHLCFRSWSRKIFFFFNFWFCTHSTLSYMLFSVKMFGFFSFSLSTTGSKPDPCKWYGISGFGSATVLACS